MAKSTKQTPKKTTKNQSNQTDDQNLRPVGIVFLIVGFVMVVTDTALAAGIPFLVLGITFFAISQRDTSV